MILQIGRKRHSSTPLDRRSLLNRHRRHLTGFTLIELIIVAAIIVILVAISSPRFRNTFRDLALKDTAYNISKLIKYGQERAIMEEKRYRLLFDFDKDIYYLLVEAEKKEEREFSASAEGEGGPASGWKKPTGRFGEHFYLPEGVKLKADKDRLTFLPNGRCDKISIYVTNQKGRTIEIATNGRAGYVNVSEVEERQ